MHDFPRLELENYSRRLILTNTTSLDYGTYEADVHVANDTILVVEFSVGPPGKCI